MVSIFQGLYKEKYNRCRQNYKLVDVEYKGEATETEEAGRAAFSYRISCSASAASERNLETFFIILCRIFERKPNTMQLYWGKNGTSHSGNISRCRRKRKFFSRLLEILLVIRALAFCQITELRSGYIFAVALQIKVQYMGCRSCAPTKITKCALLKLRSN